MKIKCVVFPEANKIEIVEEDVRDPNETEVLIKTEKTLISAGTELSILTGQHTHIQQGIKGAWASYPFHPGYSSAGRIIKKGKEVKNFKEGERVLSKCVHSSYVICNESGLYKIPESVTEEEAVLATLSAIALSGVRPPKIALGESSIVMGLGLVGQFAAQFLKLNGSMPVIGADISEARCAIAKKCGCEFVLNPSKDDMAAEVKKITGKDGADVVIDAAGAPIVFQACMRLARKNGKVVLLASPHGKVEIDLYSELNRNSLIVLGTNMPSMGSFEGWDANKNTVFSLFTFEKKLIKAKELITHGMNADKAKEAFEMLLNPKENTLGIILDW